MCSFMHVKSKTSFLNVKFTVEDYIADTFHDHESLSQSTQENQGNGSNTVQAIYQIISPARKNMIKEGKMSFKLRSERK